MTDHAPETAPGTAPDGTDERTFRWADIDRWAAKGLLSADQVAAIRADLGTGPPVATSPTPRPLRATPIERRPGLNLVTIAYYFGGFLILLAYTVFLGLLWEDLPAGAQAAILLVTIGGLWAIGGWLRGHGFPQGGGVLIFVGTAITPLLVYSVQRWTGLWPDDSAQTDAYEDFYRTVAPAWVAMEAISIAIANLVLWRVRFPLLTLPIAFWGWFLGMDLARWARRTDDRSWDMPEQAVGATVAVALLVIGTALDRRGLRPYRRWFYLFGAVALFGHLGAMWLRYEDTRWAGPAYLAASLLLVVASVALQARVFLVFGALGSYAYASYLAFAVFDGALGFLFALAGIGLFIVLSTVAFQRYGRVWLEHLVGRRATGAPTAPA
ncbi:MAG: hypothetical protein AVDCRST_MAG49-828 [uncultured Thermomicrobiales bacterium]|uniref:DUF2157 domain-containing protein n=1 Tax=uncultured Thermomicrobiales bacterium TaxID=1645740 RepID=A0A6J4U7G3_9BACT|nr:MAG: hypothetical protein AVDCRST_MAG49-828 [uncultured Thermomicrobiales bacterium]